MAAELLTLEQAKNYLRVSYDEDDEEISGLILTAEAYIDSCVGTGYKDKANYESDEEYEKGRRIAALLLENRKRYVRSAFYYGRKQHKNR